MTRHPFRGYSLFASALLLAFAAPVAAGQASDPRATQLETALAANQGNAAVQRCLQNDSAVDEYQRAVMAVERSRDPKVPGKFNCSGIGASWQEVGPAACCSVFEHDKSSNADAAWVALQQCGWRAEVEKRRPAYLQAANKCLAQAGAGATLPTPPPAGGQPDPWRTVPSFDQIKAQILGKDACAITGGPAWSVFDNAGRQRGLPGVLADRVQRGFALLDDRAWLQTALTSVRIGLSVDEALAQMARGGPDPAKQFIWFGDTFVRHYLPNASLSIPVGRDVDLTPAATAAPTRARIQRISSEHSSVRGTCNGGGDFIRFDPNLEGSPVSAPRVVLAAWSSAGPAAGEPDVRVELPSAVVTADGGTARVVVDLAPNGAAAVLVIAGQVQVRDTTTGSAQRVRAGDAVLVWPGTGVSSPVAASGTRLARAARPRIRGSIVLRPGERWSGPLRLDHTLPLEARLLYDKPAGSAYALEITINGQPLTDPLLNKTSPMRYADGRNYPYREPNSARWMLFSSADYDANNAPAGGGYRVMTDPGQAYRYAWNVAPLMAGNATAQVQFRNAADPGGLALELRLLPAEGAGTYTDTAVPRPPSVVAGSTTPPASSTPGSEPKKPGGGWLQGLADAAKNVAKDALKQPSTTAGVTPPAYPPPTTSQVPYGSSSAQGVPHLAVYAVPRILAHGDFNYPVVVQLQDAGGRPMYPAAPLTVTVTSSHPNIVAMYLPNRPASTTLTLKPPDQYSENGLSWDKVQVIAATAFAAGSATITATAPGLPGASVTVTTVPTRTPDNRSTAAQTAPAASVSLTVIPPVVETDRRPVIIMDLLDARGDPTGVDFGPGEWTLDSSNAGVFPTYSSSGRNTILNPIGPGQTQLTIRPKRPGVTGSTATLTVISPKHIELTTSVPEVTGILIEAEDETESFIRPLSERPAPNMEEIAPAWRPPYSGSGDWYLATGGEFLKYRVNVPRDATYYVWVRDYVDRFQPRGVRRIIVEFDGRTYGTFGEVDKDAPGDRGVFGWHKIGSGVHFTAGTHTMTVTKEAPTTGAAILDAFYFTTNVNDTPAEPADNRYTSVVPQTVQPPPPTPTQPATTSSVPYGVPSAQGVAHLAIYTVPQMVGHSDWTYPVVVQLQDGAGQPMYPAATLTVTVTSSNPGLVNVYDGDADHSVTTLRLRPPDRGTPGLSWDSVNAVAVRSDLAASVTISASAPGLPGASVTVPVVPMRTAENRSLPTETAPAARARLTVLPPIVETDRMPLMTADLLDASGQLTGSARLAGWTLQSSNPAVMETSKNSGRGGQLPYPRTPGQTQLTLIPERSSLTGSSAMLTIVSPQRPATTTAYAPPPPTVAVAPPVPMLAPAPTGTAGRVVPRSDFGEPAGPSGRISNIVTARDVRNGVAVDITDTFSQDVNPIHVWFRLSGFEPGTTLTSRWTYLGGSTPLVIGTGEFMTSPASDYGTFSYELAAGKRWPAGDYRMEILLDRSVIGSATFIVSGGNRP